MGRHESGALQVRESVPLSVILRPELSIADERVDFLDKRLRETRACAVALEAV